MFICNGIMSQTLVDIEENNENILKTAALVYSLNHLKYDFYNQSSDVIVQVYVKEVKQDSLNVIFKDDALKLRFKTSSNDFLKLHSHSSEETLFEWHVYLRHGIDSTLSKHKISKGKITLLLKKQKNGKWNSLHSLNGEGTGNSNSKNLKKLQHVTETNKSNISPTTPDSEVQCKVNRGHSSSILTNLQNMTNHGSTVKCNSIYDNENKNTTSLGECYVNPKESTTQSEEEINEELKCDSHSDSQSFKKEDKLIKENRVKVNTGVNIIDKAVSKGCTDEPSPSKPFNGAEHCNATQTNIKLTNEILNTSIRDDVQCFDVTTPTEQSSKGPSNIFLSKTLTSNDPMDTISTSKNVILNYDAKLHCCRPGFSGLINPQNMCYVNSMVQCLSAVQELRNYILSEQYCLDINRISKHGFGGDLVICFGSLIKMLWSGEKNCANAKELKDILGRRHNHFKHLGQGDAQEFLTFLLDGLHEDLKNQENKFIETEIEKDCRNILENGELHWQKFIDKNHSIIIDLFHGQSISDVTCRDCKKTSLRFDPWMQLNLPIPNEPKILPVYVFFLDPARKPLQIKIMISDAAYCIDVLRQTSEIVNVPANELVLICPRYNRISRIYDPADDISSCQIEEYLIACEIIPQENNMIGKDDCSTPDYDNNSDIHDSNNLSNSGCPILYISVIQRSTHRIVRKCSYCSNEKAGLKHCSKCCMVAYCDSECQRKHWKSHRGSCEFQPNVIGCPFMLSIPASQATEDELKNKVLQYARYSVGIKEGELENGPLHLRLLENITDVNTKGKVINQKGDGPVVCENVCISLDWESVVPNNKVRSKRLDCDVHESAKKELSVEDSTCSLRECLDLYWKPETIRKETGWRCDYCKDVRPADRNVKILRHPKNMIIDIKRFSYEGNGRKIRKSVSFPLKGLDMSPYSYHNCKNKNSTIYDLHAVCTHRGLMNFGHYVSYAKPYSNEELNALGLVSTDGWLCYNDMQVDCVSEDRIERTEAYILFYQRRDDDTVNVEEQTHLENSVQSLEILDSDEKKACTDNLVYKNADLHVPCQTKIINPGDGYKSDHETNDCEFNRLHKRAESDNNTSSRKNKSCDHGSLEDELD